MISKPTIKEIERQVNTLKELNKEPEFIELNTITFLKLGKELGIKNPINDFERLKDCCIDFMDLKVKINEKLAVNYINITQKKQGSNNIYNIMNKIMSDLDKEKKINSVKNSIGQIEKGIDEVETWLNADDFQDFCDNAYTCISYLRTIIKKVGGYEC